MVLDWCAEQLPTFIAHRDWPSSSPGHNPMDYSMWAILERKVCSTRHPNLDSLKEALLKSWDEIDETYLRATCEAFVGRLKNCVKAKGDHFKNRHTPIFHASVVAEEAAPAAPSQVKECDSTPTSTVPSPCSAESTSEGPPTAKRRRTAPSLTPPSSDEFRPAAPAPPPQTPHSITALFMTQQLLALQYQQNLKMAAMAPGMLPTINPLHPFTAMATIPWRTM
ncbi:unnamed protein product [Nippostrongylus brasiliensis]|uniref:DDE_3 domain-containing protein n=1 Tax=Nippostrongylus brasiliensis TaxID=27835 RepID=A0A158QYD4_NIPBR|nr:unnamed protein product [Nippostrongylus brasiliensis]